MRLLTLKTVIGTIPVNRQDQDVVIVDGLYEEMKKRLFMKRISVGHKYIDVEIALTLWRYQFW